MTHLQALIANSILEVVPNMSTTKKEENFMEITSRASGSSTEESSDEQSNAVSLKSRSSTVTAAESNSSAMDVDMPDSPIQLSDANLSIDSLEYLGHLTRFSTELDWALIEIRNQPVFSTISELKTSEQHSDPNRFISDTQVMVHTCHGLISGLLSDCAAYMRLPNSASFEEVYEVALSQPLHWGDCGAVVLNAKTTIPYGHIVSSSGAKTIAYVIAATQVFRDSKTDWRMPSSLQVENFPVELQSRGQS
jgi:hypothetical protein